MEEALRAILAEDAGVQTLVGERIQWAVREDAPSIALHLIDAPPDWHLKGPSGLTQARVQIDCWALTFLGTKAVGDAVLAALPPLGLTHDGVKFHGLQPLDIERDRHGEAPNILFRTRIDLRVSFSPA